MKSKPKPPNTHIRPLDIVKTVKGKVGIVTAVKSRDKIFVELFPGQRARRRCSWKASGDMVVLDSIPNVIAALHENGWIAGIRFHG